jgi:hypothetical protein
MCTNERRYGCTSCTNERRYGCTSEATYDDTTLQHLRKAHLDGVCANANFPISVSVRHDDVLLQLFRYEEVQICEFTSYG